MLEVWNYVKVLLNMPVRLGEITFPFTLLRFLLSFLIPLAASVVVLKLLKMGIQSLLKRTPFLETTKKRIFRWVKFFMRLLLLAAMGTLFGQLFGAEIGHYLRLFFSFLSVPLIEAGSTKITLVTIIMIIPIFYLASWLGKLTKNFVDQGIVANFSLDEAKRFGLTAFTRYGVMVATILVGLSIVGVDLSSLAVIFGVLGIGLGFGLQGMVGNFFAGVIILFTRPIKENDRIIVNDLEGTVLNIRLLSSVVNTLTHETIIIPNSKLVDNVIHNYSYNDRQIIISNEIQVAYGADLHRVIAVMEELGRENPHGIPQSEVEVRVVSFDDSGITMKLLVWIGDVSKKYQAHTWNNLQIWERFKRENIEIPFPQLDLHIKEAPPQP